MQLHGFLLENMSQKKKKEKKRKERKNEKEKEKKRKRVTPRWADISGPCPASFLSRDSMYYIMLSPHNPMKPLNVVSTNSFP